MSDILNEAAAVVHGVERAGVLGRIESVLERHPTGICAFVMVDDLGNGYSATEISSNTNRAGLEMLIALARIALVETEGSSHGG